MARDFDRRIAELKLRIASLNGYTALAYQSRKLWDEFVRGKGKLGHQPICATESDVIPLRIAEERDVLE
jgi:hypothetical protein